MPHIYENKSKEESSEFKIEQPMEQAMEQQSLYQHDQRVLSKEGYDEETILRENKLLKAQLDDRTLWDGQDPNLVERDKNSLMSRVTRNDIILLYTDGTAEKDSPEMRLVKGSLERLDEILREPLKGASTAYSAYSRVIAFCRNYEGSKHPHFTAGKRRKARVTAVRMALERERERFMAAMEGFNGEIPEHIHSAMDVLEGKHIGNIPVGSAAEKLEVRRREVLGLKKSDGTRDGNQMDAIKVSFRTLAGLLSQPIADGQAFENQKTTITSEYNTLISNCEAYIRDHNPYTAEGKDRLAAIKRLLERAKMEKEYIAIAAEEEKEKMGENASWTDAFGEAAKMGENYGLVLNNLDKMFEKSVTPAKALTFFWSVNMINNEENSPLRYKILNEEVCQEFIHKHIDRKTYGKLIDYSFQLEEEIAELYNEEVKKPVPIAFLKDKNGDPMDQKARAAFAQLKLKRHPKVKLFCGLSMAFPMHIRGLEDVDKNGNTMAEFGVEHSEKHIRSLPAEAQVKLQAASDLATNIANLADKNYLDETAVNNYVALIEKETVEESKENLRPLVSKGFIEGTSADKKLAKKNIEDSEKDFLQRDVDFIFEKAKQIGLDVPELSELQKIKLQETGLGAVGEEIQIGLSFIRDSLSKLGSNAEEIYDQNAKELYYTVAAKTLYKLANVSSEGEIAAEYELSKFLTETVFELSGKHNLHELVKKAYVGDLSNGGSGGLKDEVEARRNDVPELSDKELVDYGTGLLAELCDRIRDVTAIFDKAFTEGLTDEEAALVKKHSQTIDSIMKSPKDVESIRQVAKGLKGLRFEKGIEDLIKRYEEGFNYTEAANHVAAETTMSKEKQRQLKNAKADAPVNAKEKAAKKSEAKKKGPSKEESDIEAILKAKSLPSVKLDDVADEKEAKALAAGYYELCKTLRNFRAGEDAVKDLKIGSVSFRLYHHDDGTIDVSMDNIKTTLTNRAQDIAERIETDITGNVNLYGQNAAYDVIALNEKNSDISEGRMRSLCVHALEGTTGFQGSFFTNIPTKKIIRMAKDALKGNMTKDQIKQEVDALEDSALINGEETLSLLKSMEKQADLEEKVVFKPARKEVAENEPLSWTPEEQGILNLVSDIVFTQDTWVADETHATKGERLQKVIAKPSNMDTLVYMIQNKYNNGLDNMLEKLGLPEEIKNTVKDYLDTFLGDKELQADEERLQGLEGEALEQETKKLMEELEQKQEIKDRLKNIIEAGDQKPEENAEEKKEEGGFLGGMFAAYSALKKAAVQKVDPKKLKDAAVKARLALTITVVTGLKKDLYKDFEEKLDTQVDELSEEIQKKVNNSVNVLFKGDNEQGQEQGQQQQGQQQEQDEDNYVPETMVLQMERPLSPYAKGISEEERKRRVEYKKKYMKASNEMLNKVMESMVTGKRGQGKFMRLVLTNYFNSVTQMDKRSMIASAIRNMKPMPRLPEGATQEEKEAYEKKTTGMYLGGLLKGAGPLLQKMLQGLPASGLPKELAGAVDDMKSKLAPIPPEIVKAQLLDMVKRSNGRVEKIEVTRALGAASVGQTFLCKIYGPEFKDGKDVVVKLLRPDVRNRMMREEAIMKDCAKKTDKKNGMLATYEGQLARIKEELDLTIEAANCEKGSVYDNHSKEVMSMKVDHTIEPTQNSMMLEKAEGETLDSYIKSVDEKIKKIMEPFYEYEVVQQEGHRVRKLRYITYKGEETPMISISEENASKFIEAKRQIKELLDQLFQRQQHMSKLVDIWVTEGIFKNGYYHGDLHAGNIMISDEKATVIDFGNATKLSSDQQVNITRMMMSAAAGNVAEFRKGFHALLKDSKYTTEEEYQRKRPELTRIITEVFALGDLTSAGNRIAAVLVRAQELGMEIPAEIFNFSQSQLRLQNALQDMNDRIKEAQLNALKLNVATKTLDFQPKVDVISSMQNESAISDGLFDANIKKQKEQITADLNREEFKKDFLKPGEINDEFRAKHLKKNVGVANAIKKIKEAIANNQPPEAVASELNHLVANHDEELVSSIRHGMTMLNSNPSDEHTRTMLVRTINDVDPGGVYEQLLASYDRAVELKMNNASDEEMDGALNELLDLVEKSNNQSIIYGSSYFTYVRFSLTLLDNEDILAQCKQELEPYFNDTKNGGALLRKLFEELRVAQNKVKNAPQAEKPTLTKAVEAKIDEFCRLYVPIVQSMLKDSIYLSENTKSVGEPEDFFSIMSDVLSSNQSAALKRLGGYVSVYMKYRSLMKR